MASATFEDHPTDPDKMILRKPRLDQGADYERGFVDGMQYQMQTSVDRAVNAMSQQEQEPVGYITNKRQRLNVELKPQTFVEIPTVTDWEIPLFTAPQPKQDEVDIRSRLYQRIHELEEVLKDIAEYTGEGPSTTDWQGIVKLISDSARNALEADPRPYGGASFRYGDHPTSFGLTKRTWVGLTDEEIHDCLNGLPTQTIDVYARRIEAILEDKNNG